MTDYHRAPEYTEPLTDFLDKGGVYTGAALYRRQLFDHLQPITAWTPRLKDDWALFGQFCLDNKNARFVTLHEVSYIWVHHQAQQTASAQLRDNIAEIYQFLSWFDRELEKRGELHGQRCCLIAHYYAKNAILLCELDATQWWRVADRIRALCSDERLRIGNPIARLAVRLFGIGRGVNVYVGLKKRLRPWLLLKAH
jgi:hypothetical protein